MVQSICPNLKSPMMQTQVVLSSTLVVAHLQSVSTLDLLLATKVMQKSASILNIQVSSSTKSAKTVKNTLLQKTAHILCCQATSMLSSNMQTTSGLVTDMFSMQMAQHSHKCSVNLKWQKMASQDNVMLSRTVNILQMKTALSRRMQTPSLQTQKARADLSCSPQKILQLKNSQDTLHSAQTATDISPLTPTKNLQKRELQQTEQHTTLQQQAIISLSAI